jgi:LPS export ABC transporter protein LptC
MEAMITQQSDSLTMVFSTNGEKEYRFWTPLMERYEFAKDPYMEFRYGINIITYDSLGGEASRLRADYAIFYEKRELWETRGNVVGVSADGRELHTQQLFWNQKIDKVYSNVDSRIIDGYDEFVGEGFESDSEFKEWIFKESEGRMWVESDDEGGSASGTNGEPESVERPQSYSPSENESYLEQQEQRRQEKLRRGGVGRP